MSRLLKIARREYLAYVRTFGFWLSMGLMPVGFILAFGAPAMMARSAPPPHVAVIDLTGKDYGGAVAEALKHAEAGPRGRSRPAAQITTVPLTSPGDAAEAGRQLRPYFVRGAAPSLDAAVVIHPGASGPAVDVWSRNLADGSLEDAARNAVAERMRRDRLVGLGVPIAQIGALDSLGPTMATFSPKAQGHKATFRDRLPGLAGFGLGMLLWAMIFTGAGILLNSVIEEKSSRVLEVLLASASIPEIMGGKILGVAGVTATVLGLWVSIGAVALISLAPHVAADLGAVLVGRGLIFYFAAYLVAGYVMFACLFTAIGAHCESNREAQTLLGPIMIICSIPVIFMGQAIARPDTPAIALLSWFPPFTPFLMPIRAASDPPLWQMAGAALLTIATAVASAWLSVRAFRAGALSGGRSDSRPLIARLFRPAQE